MNAFVEHTVRHPPPHPVLLVCEKKLILTLTLLDMTQRRMSIMNLSYSCRINHKLCRCVPLLLIMSK